MNRWMDKWMINGWKDGRKVGWINGLIDKYINGWKDGRIDEEFGVYIYDVCL